MKEVRGGAGVYAVTWRKSVPNLGSAVVKGRKAGVSVKSLRNSRVQSVNEGERKEVK